MNEIEMMLTKAIEPDVLLPDPNDSRYTIPRTWGVYDIGASQCGAAGKPFRKGNHPARRKELQRENVKVKVVGLFIEEKQAAVLALQLNPLGAQVPRLSANSDE